MEDSGGIWGYEEKLGILLNKEHEDYEELLEWMGDDVDPERFERKEINERLKSLR